MTKRDFLLSLSKDELVDLIFGFSETNREAGDFIQKKIYQAEAFGQNNKQENLLENPKAMNAEVPAAEISADTNAINRFSSPEKKSRFLNHFFQGGLMFLPCAGTTKNQIKADIRRYAKTNGFRENAT